MSSKNNASQATSFSCAMIALILMFMGAPRATGQGTAFTYQGVLHDASSQGVANGLYDLAFSLYSDSIAPDTQVGATLTNLNTGVTNGIFTVNLDFGPGIFTGSNLWLDIGVRTNGGAAFTELAPRQRLTSTPYAVSAANAVNFTGMIADSQLSTNVAMLNAGQTFSGAVNFANVASVAAGNVTAQSNIYSAGMAAANWISMGAFVTNYAIEAWSTNTTAAIVFSNNISSAFVGSFSLDLCLNSFPWNFVPRMATNSCGYAERKYSFISTNVSSAPAAIFSTTVSGLNVTLNPSPGTGSSPQSYFTITMSGLNGGYTNHITGFATMIFTPFQ